MLKFFNPKPIKSENITSLPNTIVNAGEYFTYYVRSPTMQKNYTITPPTEKKIWCAEILSASTKNNTDEIKLDNNKTISIFRQNNTITLNNNVLTDANSAFSISQIHCIKTGGKRRRPRRTRTTRRTRRTRRPRRTRRTRPRRRISKK